MPAWKVLFIALFACVFLGLGFATFIVPMTTSAGEHRWLWLAGLLAATVVVGVLLSLFLRRAGRFM
jgi:hypothetical protein